MLRWYPIHSLARLSVLLALLARSFVRASFAAFVVSIRVSHHSSIHPRVYPRPPSFRYTNPIQSNPTTPPPHSPKYPIPLPLNQPRMLQHLLNGNPFRDIAIEHLADEVDARLAHDVRHAQVAVHDLVDAVEGVFLVDDGVQ